MYCTNECICNPVRETKTRLEFKYRESYAVINDLHSDREIIGKERENAQLDL